VITEDVPSGALALGRGRQVNKAGWKPKAGGRKKAARKAVAGKPRPKKKR
jgi:bifunctional N-acetylglucosamine-1-phosphate-uridyltransferase/glucosamine-1-phosphate-acetyltransferase GlmU-like protein